MFIDNNIHCMKSSVILSKNNRDLELNRIFNCNFTGPIEQKWLTTSYLNDFADHRMKMLNKNQYNNLTDFQWFCYSNLASFNMCHKMKTLGFNYDWNNYQEDCGYFEHKNTIEDVRLEICRHINYYDKEELFIDFSKYHKKEVCLNYNANTQFKNGEYLFLSSIYQFIKWLQENDYIKIIDKKDYIMFYKPDGDKVKLIRTEDNDIEWTEKDFSKAVKLIFNII